MAVIRHDQGRVDNSLRRRRSWILATVGKHSVEHRQPHTRAASWKAILATLVLMTFPFIGADTLDHPNTCNHQPMNPTDRCVHYRKASEYLSAPETPDAPGVYSYNDQITYHYILGTTLLTIGATAWATAAFWLTRRLRTDTTPR